MWFLLDCNVSCAILSSVYRPVCPVWPDSSISPCIASLCFVPAVYNPDLDYRPLCSGFRFCTSIGLDYRKQTLLYDPDHSLDLPGFTRLLPLRPFAWTLYYDTWLSVRLMFAGDLPLPVYSAISLSKLLLRITPWLHLVPSIYKPFKAQ